jgi:hemerythrin-like domain-containing protein
MESTSQTSRTLHDEHRANLALLGRVESALAQRGAAGGAADDALRALLRELVRQLEHETQRHFAFEEAELFVRMSDAGENDIAAVLLEEHEAIRAVAADLLPAARQAIDGTLDAAGWQALRRDAFELVERQVAHIQKEEMALLPMLEDLLDDETDRQLAFAYATA